jgi:hypothetical protein
VANGEKEELVRRCYCGYEEFKEAEKADENNDSNTLEPMTIVLICVGGAIVVAAAAITVAVTVKKKKTQK